MTARQWLHPRLAPKMDWDIVDHAPAVGIDLDRPPMIVAQVDVDAIVEVADAQEDLVPVAVVMRFCLDGLERARHRFGVDGEPPRSA